MIRDKKIAKRHRYSHQNYSSLETLYHLDYVGWYPQEFRKDSQWGPFHELAEQSVIQWAISYQQQENNNIWAGTLAVVIIKEIFMLKKKDARTALAFANAMRDVLLQEGKNGDPNQFCKRAWEGIGFLDVRTVAADFDAVKFTDEHLPDIPEGKNMKGLYRSWDGRDQLQQMLEDGEYPD